MEAILYLFFLAIGLIIWAISGPSDGVYYGDGSD